MKRIIGGALLCAMTVSLISGCSPVVENNGTTSETSETFPSRPQDDFYYYVNKDRVDNAVFEYGASTAADAGEQELVDEQIETVIKDVVSGSGYEKGSEEYIIQSAYNAYLAYDFSKEPIPEELTATINSVKNAESVDELLRLDAEIYRDYGVGNYLGLSVEKNYFVSGEHILTFRQAQGMIGVDFDNVREDNTALNSIVTDTKTIMQTLDYDEETSEQYGRELANLVLKIYGSTDLEEMDTTWAFEYVSICSADETDDIFTNINISDYTGMFGYDKAHCDKFCVMDKNQAECLNSIFVDENINALKAWKIYDIYSGYMRVLAPHYDLLAGYVTDSYDTPEQQAIDEIKSKFSAETDPIYVERYYSKATDDALVSMCDDIKEGYRNLISNASWLSEPTRKGLLEKLDNIVYITGADVGRRDTSIFIDLDGNYYFILTRYLRQLMQERIASLGDPVDRKKAGMRMQTLNACYSPSENNITITVAITNEPYFSAGADYYTNLGGLGSVIGHEMGHAFDSNCIVFDKNGVYNPAWIADVDMKKLLERNEKAASYFEDNFTVFGVYHVDGERTLGENYADLGGMECVTSLAGSEDDLKKIFENYATCWCCKKVDVAIIDQLAYDEHSPEVIRVNAILSTLDCFYDVYDVKEGDGMYIAPENRISRWY